MCFKSASANQNKEQRPSISRRGYKSACATYSPTCGWEHEVCPHGCSRGWFNKCMTLICEALPHFTYWSTCVRDTLGYRTSGARPKAPTKGPLMFLYQQFAFGLDRHTDFPPLRYTAEPYYLTEPPNRYLRSVWRPVIVWGLYLTVVEVR